MDIFREEPEFTDIRMAQRVVDIRPHMQRLVRLGLFGREYSDELDDSDEDNYEIDNWVHGYNHPRSSNSIHQHPMRYWTSADSPPLQPPVNVQVKESDADRKAKLLHEAKKSKEKAEKKRLKKQKRKERKELERLEKEKQNPVKNDEEKGGAQPCKADDDTTSRDNTDFSVKQFASAQDTESSESSEDESGDEDSNTKSDSGDTEELDMASAFVKLAKLKLQQKPKPEKKNKSPVKEEHKTVSDKFNEEAEKKDLTTNTTLTLEDNIKISTDFAIIGNKFAASGDYNTAVKYFTDAIRYNPTEYKLFGNRSFCFEKKQEYEKALTDAELCLRLAPGWVKGLFRKGRALAGLKRYEEAAQAFREVLKLDSSCAEAAQELMRVQITQLMEFGFSREQSSNALIIHGTVKKALEVLTKLNQPGATIQNATFLPAQVVNVSGVSPVLSASTSSSAPLPQSHDAPLKNKPFGPAQNMSDVQSQHKLVSNQAARSSSEVNQTLELFPVWVGNLVQRVTDSMITNLFNKAGVVYSVKILPFRRCAFVNFTQQEYCEEAIRRFHGYELNGMRLVVRYPDRIPFGMGISKSALKANLQDDSMRQSDHADERNAVGGWRPVHPHRGNQKN